MRSVARADNEQLASGIGDQCKQARVSSTGNVTDEKCNIAGIILCAAVANCHAVVGASADLQENCKIICVLIKKFRRLSSKKSLALKMMSL